MEDRSGRHFAWAGLVLSVGLALLVAACSTGQTAATSVNPDDLGNPVLKRIVSGLTTRRITVLAATVEAQSPLRLSVSVSTASSSGDPRFVEAQTEREVAAEWQRDRQPSEVMIQAIDARGRVVFGHGLPLASMYFTDVAPAQMTTAAAQHLIAVQAESLVPSPFKIASLELIDDVLGARLLHVRVSTSDFRNNESPYMQGFTDLQNAVNELNQRRGTAVGVEWMEAIDERGQMLYSSWWDYQLNIATDEPGLIRDFRPRFFPAPTVQPSVSSSSSPRRREGL